MTSRTELADLDCRIEQLRRFEQDYRLRLRVFHQQQLNDLDQESGSVTLPRLPSDQRKRLIQWLATQVIEDRTGDWPTGVTPYLLAIWGTSALRGGLLDRAFKAYVDAERERRQSEARKPSRPDVVPLLQDRDDARNVAMQERLHEKCAQVLAVLVDGGPQTNGSDSAPKLIYPDE